MLLLFRCVEGMDPPPSTQLSEAPANIFHNPDGSPIAIFAEAGHILNRPQLVRRLKVLFFVAFYYLLGSNKHPSDTAQSSAAILKMPKSYLSTLRLLKAEFSLVTGAMT